MKFDMGSSTLSSLSQATSTASQDLGSYVKRLAQAAEPLEGKFNGAGRAAFDQFKAHTDEIANSLNAALAAVLGGIAGQDKAFGSGDSQIADMSKQRHSSVDFDGAKFGSK